MTRVRGLRRWREPDRAVDARSRIAAASGEPANRDKILTDDRGEVETVARRVHDRRSAGGFSVALSGGGNRATLLTMGGLLALVDRGLERKRDANSLRLRRIYSNAVVAQRCASTNCRQKG